MERWRIRNSILSLLAKNRAGNYIYQLLQKHFGQFNNPVFINNKIDEINKIILFALDNGVIIKNASILELGTGWVPLAPVMFSLYGARSVTSIDLNSYYIPSLLKKSAVAIIDKIENESINNSSSITADNNKLELLKKYSKKPDRLIQALDIKLLSPVDARSTGFADNLFDLYYSMDTLEHIPPDDIHSILKESRRIVKPQGSFLHSIDLADHFSYTDSKISSINFLQYTEDEWTSLCNRYTYHNRMRKSDYKKIINSLEFAIIDKIEKSDVEVSKASGNRLNHNIKNISGKHEEAGINRLIYLLH